MADLVITAASVVPGTGAKTRAGTAGATITAGQVVYRSTTTLKFGLADNNSVTAAIRSPVGVALHGASDGQPLTILTEGDLTLNAVLTAGVVYYLSDTPGGICPVADLAAGEYPTIIGIAESTTVLNVKLHESGVAL
jgi:hypothetical protein